MDNVTSTNNNRVNVIMYDEKIGPLDVMMTANVIDSAELIICLINYMLVKG